MVKRRFRIDAFLICSVMAVAVALPSSARNSSIPISFSDPSKGVKPEQVSWQSIFWGLSALALQAMSFPSVHDGERPTSSLLFPARASPVVCLTDTFETFFYFYSATLRTRSLRDAASYVSVWRLQERFDTVAINDQDVVNVAMKNHPRASLVLCLATMTQFVKIMGMQGIVAPKIIASIYVLSYLVQAGLVLMVKNVVPVYEEIVPRQSSPSEADSGSYSSIASGVAGYATALTICWCCFALKQVFSPKALEPSITDALRDGDLTVTIIVMISECIGSLVTFVVRTWTCGIVLVPPGVAFVIYLECEPNRRPRPLKNVIFVGVMLLIPLFYVIYDVIPRIIRFDFPYYILDTLNGLCLFAMAFIGIYIVAKLFDAAAVLGYRAMGSRVRMHAIDPWFILTATYVLFLGLYYSLVYDPTGTIKPPWTEALG